MYRTSHAMYRTSLAMYRTSLVMYGRREFIKTKLAEAASEHQASLNEKLKTLEASLAGVNNVLSHRNDHEFEVAAETWKRMMKACGEVRHTFGAIQSNAPEFALMDEPTTLATINKFAIHGRAEA